ncbi:MAG TPA: NTF2 fold immunity protein [Candidatus Eisenbacteria bacterium]|nr:NTF2 fold immunity protein [Candidatus Eisenbacteria bacterium]
MRWMLASILLLSALAFSSDASKKHRDYVPDEKTARSIAEAVLVGQYGEERIKAESPLLVDGSNRQYWIVQVSGGNPPMKGGGPAVWIDKYSGCLKIMERMK